MQESAGFYRNDFQTRVYEQFKYLKSLNETQTMERSLYEQNKNKGFWGCLVLPFAKFGMSLGKKYYLRESEKYNYPENERRANELLAQDDIREILCFALYEVGGKEILTEERMVRAVVDTLGKSEIRDRFSIPLNEILFAFLAYQLLQKGLENYWPNKS